MTEEATNLPADAHEWGIDDWRAWQASQPPDNESPQESPPSRPAPDASGYKMTTIRDGFGGGVVALPIVAFALLVLVFALT